MKPFKLKNLKKLVDSESWNKDQLIYNVESETIKLAKLHTDFFLSRYHKQKEGHWSQKEKRNILIGLLCQKVFHLILQQLQVSCDINDPTIDWRFKKDYDFFIPNLGKIEVKGFDFYTRKVLVKTSEWHGNDFLVVFKVDEKFPKIYLMGYLTKKEVESLPISKKGHPITRFADAYITDFDTLKPSCEFIAMLRKESLD